LQCSSYLDIHIDFFSKLDIGLGVGEFEGRVVLSWFLGSHKAEVQLDDCARVDLSGSLPGLQLDLGTAADHPEFYSSGPRKFTSIFEFPLKVLQLTRLAMFSVGALDDRCLQELDFVSVHGKRD